MPDINPSLLLGELVKNEFNNQRMKGAVEAGVTKGIANNIAIINDPKKIITTNLKVEAAKLVIYELLKIAPQIPGALGGLTQKLGHGGFERGYAKGLAEGLSSALIAKTNEITSMEGVQLFKWCYALIKAHPKGGPLLRFIELTAILGTTAVVTKEVVNYTTKMWALKKAAEYAVDVLKDNITRRLESLLKLRVISPENFQSYLDQIAKLTSYQDLSKFFENMNLRYPPNL